LDYIQAHDVFEKTVNYSYLQERMNIIKEELIAVTLHPNKLQRHIDLGGEIDDF
jgi:hypothetical protein